MRSFDPQRSLARWRVFEERYGMPFGIGAEEAPVGNGARVPRRRRCRTRRAGYRVDGSSRAAARVLHDRAPPRRRGEHPRRRSRARSLDASRIVELVDDAEVVAEYERQLAEARSAAGTPADVQGKTATRGGPPALHRAVGRLPAERRLRRRRRRLAAAARLRRPPRQLRARARANAATGVARAAARVLPGRSHDRRGRAPARRRPRSGSGHRGRRAPSRAPRGRRERRSRARGCRLALACRSGRRRLERDARRELDLRPVRSVRPSSLAVLRRP